MSGWKITKSLRCKRLLGLYENLRAANRQPPAVAGFDRKNLRAANRQPASDEADNRKNLRAANRQPSTNTKTKLDLTKACWDFHKPSNAVANIRYILENPKNYWNYFS